MSITINGSGTINGLTPGGLPNGSVLGSDLADATITPIKLTGFVVANQTPLPGSAAALISFNHGLGVVPASAKLELICLTAEYGYQVGDVIADPLIQPSSAFWINPTIRRTSSVVEVRLGSFNTLGAINHTNGSHTQLSFANWAWRFKVYTV